MEETKKKGFLTKFKQANFYLMYYLFYNHTQASFEEILLELIEIFQILSLSINGLVKYFLTFFFIV
jgi:hypothetical protein